MYHQQIRELDARYHEVSNLIEYARGDADQARLPSLLRQQQEIMQQLTQLRRAQWEVDHDSFDMDPEL